MKRIVLAASLAILGIVTVAHGQIRNSRVLLFLGDGSGGRPVVQGSGEAETSGGPVQNAMLSIVGTGVKITADEVQGDGQAFVLKGNVRITVDQVK